MFEGGAVYALPAANAIVQRHEVKGGNRVGPTGPGMSHHDVCGPIRIRDSLPLRLQWLPLRTGRFRRIIGNLLPSSTKSLSLQMNLTPRVPAAAW